LKTYRYLEHYRDRCFKTSYGDVQKSTGINYESSQWTNQSSQEWYQRTGNQDLIINVIGKSEDKKNVVVTNLSDLKKQYYYESFKLAYIH